MSGRTILIGGGTGLVGSRLSEMLEEKNYNVLHLSRKAKPDARFPAYKWDLKNKTIDEAAIEKADYVINLAGAGIVDGRWTTSRKKLIIDSRVDSTMILKNAFEKAGKTPKAFISAAAIGFYGNTGEDWVKETDQPADNRFLSHSCVEWEKTLDEVKATGWRTARIRIAIVLSTKGGALEKIMLPLKANLGGYFGDGQQWYSWIHIDDLCNLFIYALENENFKGTFNGGSPNPERNKPFTQKVADAMDKTALLAPGPSFVMRLAMGEMADTILNSNRISAEKVEASGFEFQFPELEGAVRDLIQRKI